ncbi:MAG: YbbR-like protein [Firmicutes bacterium ADurb.Bin248]|nr:MAG: YbbR-like protein [Firmicutes bacterium ADurb.Bin248]HOF99485.1 CdaR family protein [Clostridia bacterium]HPK15178.1 CdaR family protein [Clostridia bacterium]
MTNSNQKFSATLKSFVRDFFTKRIALKVVSLVFAMLLWGYVLMMQDPARIKTISNVNVTIEGEADLIARKLVIRGNKQFSDVIVKVKTQLTQYADLNIDDITATINLAGITEKGTYKITISAKTTTGDIASISPSQVTVEVDKLVTRRVPVEIGFTGALPDGYWAGDPVVGRSEIDIEGAAQDLANIEQAAADIDLTGVSEPVNRSVTLTLFDGSGNAIPSDVLLGTLPSVTVRMDVLPVIEVPVDTDSALLGTDNLPANFELVSCRIVSGPRTVRLAGEADALAAISSVALDPIDISGMRQSVKQSFAMILPDGVNLLDEDSVELFIEIREKSGSTFFAGLPIEVRGIGRKLKAALSVEAADVTLSGRVGLVNLLERGDVALYIDLTGYAAGTYEVPVYVELPTDEMAQELVKALSAQFVTVVIS